jgi:hypothetical protein
VTIHGACTPIEDSHNKKVSRSYDDYYIAFTTQSNEQKKALDPIEIC